MKRSFTRADIARYIRAEFGFPQNECLRLVGSILDQMVIALTDGEAVKIKNFGCFEVIHRPLRSGTNFRTGGRVAIAPRRAVVFRPSGRLLNKVSKDVRVPETDAK